MSSPLPLNPLIGDVLTSRSAHSGMPAGTSGAEPETAILRRVRAAADPSTAAHDASPAGDRPARRRRARDAMTGGRAAYRVRMGLVALLCGAALAGCGIPRSSDVLDGRRVGDNVAPRARIVMNPPAVGAPPDVIARDFIRSGRGLPGDRRRPAGRRSLVPRPRIRRPVAADRAHDDGVRLPNAAEDRAAAV